MYQRLILCLMLMQSALWADIAVHNQTGKYIKFRLQSDQKIRTAPRSFRIASPIDIRFAPNDIFVIEIDPTMIKGSKFTVHDYFSINKGEFDKLRGVPLYKPSGDPAGQYSHVDAISFTIPTDNYAKIVQEAKTFIPTITISIDPLTKRTKMNFPASEKELQEAINIVKEQTQKELKKVPVSHDPLKIIEEYADTIPSK